MGVFCIKASVSISSDVTVRGWAEHSRIPYSHPKGITSRKLSPRNRKPFRPQPVNMLRVLMQINTLADALQLLHAGPLVKLAACAAATAALWLTLKFGMHPLALPAMLCGIPAAFHVARLAAGVSIAELQQSGWLLQSKVAALMRKLRAHCD